MSHPPALGRETSPNTDLARLHEAALSREGPLLERVSALIEQTRSFVATQVNSALTLRNWHIGRMIDAEVLRKSRAGYDQEIVASLERQLTKRFGKGFNRADLYRMIQFSQVFPNEADVTLLGQQLSWTHLKAILPVRSPEARAFYIEQAISARLSVRALDELIGRQGYERKEIANAQTPGGSVVPADTFRDPYFLELLGLHDSWAERDLEEAIIRDMEAFLLEAGDGWTFVARQERIARRQHATAPEGNEEP